MKGLKLTTNTITVTCEFGLSYYSAIKCDSSLHQDTGIFWSLFTGATDIETPQHSKDRVFHPAQHVTHLSSKESTVNDRRHELQLVLIRVAVCSAEQVR